LDFFKGDFAGANLSFPPSSIFAPGVEKGNKKTLLGVTQPDNPLWIFIRQSSRMNANKTNPKPRITQRGPAAAKEILATKEH
jgi:hypothetical protein